MYKRQITDGQLKWNKLEEEFDVVSIGYGAEQRKYPIPAGYDNWIKQLKEKFPTEHNAIDEYFKLVKSCKPAKLTFGLLKVHKLI